MKQTFFFLFIALWGYTGFTQTVLEYTYDEAGNQTFRKEKTISNPPDGIIRPIDSDERAIASLSTEEINNKFQVSPNPTSGVAELTWDQDISESITKIELVSLMSSERTDIKFSRQQAVSIDLSSKITGIYIIMFHLNNEKISVVQKKLIRL